MIMIIHILLFEGGKTIQISSDKLSFEIQEKDINVTIQPKDGIKIETGKGSKGQEPKGKSDKQDKSAKDNDNKTEEYWIAKIENAHTKKDWKKLLEIQVELMEANRKKYHSSFITREPYLKPLKLLNKYLKEFGQKKWDWFKKDVSRYLNEFFNKSEDEYRILEDRVNRLIFEKKGTQEEADKCLEGAKKRAKTVRKTIQKAKKEHSITLKKLFDNQGNSTKILGYIKDFLIKYNIPQDLKVSISYSAPCLDGSDENTTKKLTVKISGSKKYHIKPTETIRLIATVSGGKAPVDIHWEGGNISPSGSTAIFAATTPGSYSVQITAKDANGESISDVVSIVVEKIDLPTLSGLPNEVYYGTTKIISVEGLEESTVSKKEESSSFGNMIDCKTHPDNPFCVNTSTGQIHRNITKDGDDSAPSVIMAPTDDTEDFGVPEIKKEEKGEYKYVWQPTGEGLEFNPPEGNQPQVKVTFGNIGDVEIWAEVHKDGELLGETEPIKTKVVPPNLKLKVDPSAPKIMQQCIARLEITPKIDNKFFTLRWPQTDNNIQKLNESDSDKTMTFRLRDSKQATVEVQMLAKNPYYGDELGIAKIKVAATKYEIGVSQPKRLGMPPRRWDPKLGKAIELPQAIAVFQDAEVHCTIMPKPQERVSYKWTVFPEGCSVSAPMSQSTNINAHEIDTYVVSVKVLGKDGVELGKGSTTLNVTVSQRDMDVAKQQAQKKEKAKELLHQGLKLWKESKLQQAISKVSQALNLIPKDKEIDKTLKSMQTKKKSLDKKLSQASDLIKQGKLEAAKKVLDSATLINKKYKKVQKELQDAQKRAEEKKKQIEKLLKKAKSLKDAGKLNEAVEVLEKGKRQFPKNKEIKKLLNEIKKQQSDAIKKMHDGQNQWKEGMLGKAIESLKEALKIDPSNRQIIKVLKGMRGQKKIIDDTLKKVDALIEQKKFNQGVSTLKKAEYISKKYLPYIEMVKKIQIEKSKVEKDKEQEDARKKMEEGQKQWKEGVLDKAILTLKEAAKIDLSNKKIAKVLKGMQSQKKIMDDTLKKVDLLIKQKKFHQAGSTLKKVGYISMRYLPYIMMVKKRERAKQKDEESANALVKQAKDLWSAGKLGDTIAILTKGSSEFVFNEKINQSLKKRKQEKKNFDSMIRRAEQLTGQKKFIKAKDLLHKTGLISQKYLPYIKAIKRLNIEKEKADKLRRRQADALNKMSEGQKLWENGMLDKAISTLSEATKIDSLNKKITKVLKDIRTQKKIIDDVLIEVKGLLEHKKFGDATKVLQKVESINNKYPPYLQMVKELNSANLKAEELKNELKKILKNALTLKNSGKLSKAIKVLKKGHRYFPQNEQINKLLKDIQKQQAEEASAHVKPPQKPKTEKIDNIGGVVNGPKKPTTFKFNTKVKLLFLQTYHWNNGRGTTSPGQIGLRHSDGTMYGPWQTKGKAGQGGVPNANWAVNPNIILKSGTYKVIDSDTKTWATNAQEGWKGFVIIRTGPVNYPDERSVSTSKVNGHNSSKDNLKIEAKYLGCYRDKGVVESAKDRDIDGHYNRSNHMTIKTCTTLCSKKGFKYAGVQNANGCFCGNLFGRNGIAGNCNMSCTGNKNEICGGRWANSVYELTTKASVKDDRQSGSIKIISATGKSIPPASKVVVTKPERPALVNSSQNGKIEAKYIGCYKEKGYKAKVVPSMKNRVLNGYTFGGNMTVSKCTKVCSGKSFKYAAVQYANHCFCGNLYGKYGIASNCNMSCSGNKNETCGGAWANSVYELSTKVVSDDEEKEAAAKKAELANRINNIRIAAKAQKDKNHKAELAAKIKTIREAAEAIKLQKEIQDLKNKNAELVKITQGLEEVAEIDKIIPDEEKEKEAAEKVRKAQKALVKYSGTIKGSWKGPWSSKGTFVMNISEYGKISGHYWGDDEGKLNGSVSGSGKLNMKSGGGAAGSGTWDGAIKVDAYGKLKGSGTWNVDGYKGTWHGSRNVKKPKSKSLKNLFDNWESGLPEQKSVATEFVGIE